VRDDIDGGRIEAIRQLKARYCRYLDTRDVEGWRGIFVPDLTVLLDGAVSTGGADPQTDRRSRRRQLRPDVLGTLEGVATVHHCHTPEITLTSPTTATGIWAMEDLLFFPTGTGCMARATTARPTRSKTGGGGSRPCI